MNEVDQFVTLKDITFEGYRLAAFGEGELAPSPVSQGAFTLTLWLTQVNDPITITYNTKEERDAEVKIIRDYIATRS